MSIVLPRVRDFRGVSRTAFDGQGNYSLSLTEQLVFPELNPDKYHQAARHEYYDWHDGRDQRGRARCWK